MKSLALLFALACSGCFSTWAIGQASGKSLAWDENARQETVPLPASEERLVVALPMNGAVALACTSSQVARETVHRASFRYGRGWKKATAIAFAAEAATAGLIALTADRDTREGEMKMYVYGGFFAADALGTAALFFVPRKEHFQHTEREATTPVREDCPDGLALEIGGNTFPVDAAGRIGDAGEVALEDWMKTRTGSLLVTFAGRTAELRVPMQSMVGQAYVTLSVPIGTLTAIAEK